MLVQHIYLEKQKYYRVVTKKKYVGMSCFAFRRSMYFFFICFIYFSLSFSESWKQKVHLPLRKLLEAVRETFCAVISCGSAQNSSRILNDYFPSLFYFLNYIVVDPLEGCATFHESPCLQWI